MYINIDDVKDEPLSLEFEEDAETFPQLHELSRDGECVFLGPVKTHLRIYKVVITSYSIHYTKLYESYAG